ncbi:MAG: class I SAM-dependent methyltransferase [Alphaproteobacteria bacterium]|nr:class I SAM-dependent methyltransferase [Alphaproteobacteria bacterium]
MTDTLSGYVTDIPYERGFKPMLAPAWLDFAALLGGVTPPRPQPAFRWCDLGCGQGVTAAILAALHPAGLFHGIDAMPSHIEHARGLASDLGADNVRFDAVDFAAAGGLGLPPFDYIVTHGVYTWVAPSVRRQLLAFIDDHLRPGGLVYISYNALPGWTGDLPFQYLARALAETGAGDSGNRFAAASRLIQHLADADVAALAGSYMVRELHDNAGNYPRGYLVHEFLHTGWQPLYVTELRDDLAAFGLRPVASALPMENFDTWILTARQRELLAPIGDPDRRELLRDFCIDQRFRCDVFTRDAAPLDAEEQQSRLLNAGLALARAPSAITYRATTPAGELDYDNPTARAIVTRLAAGARCLAEFEASDGTPRDRIAAALALCAAGDLRPVETNRVTVGPINQALRRRLGGPAEVPLVALPCGTALEPEPASLLGMSGSDAGWRELLALHGV